MTLLPALTLKTDIYQLGLILLELTFSKRLWARGDKLNLKEYAANDH